jgi:cephalosporin hydroxylase
MPDSPFYSLIGGPQNAELRNAIQEGTLRFTYKGVPCWKDPFDLALYSMLLWKEKPRTIIEIGSAFGGSALWFYDMQRLLVDGGTVMSIDVNPPRSGLPRLVFMRGDARSLGSARVIEPSGIWLAEWLQFIERPLLVIEDSSHEPEVTLAVMRFFDPWLQPGEMIIIEDGNADVLYPGRHKGGGPLAGVREFMAERGRDYALAGEYCHFFGHNVTWNPDGYWRRIA